MPVPGLMAPFTAQCRRVRLRVFSTTPPRTSKPALAAGSSGLVPVSASFPPLEDVGEAEGFPPPDGLVLDGDVTVAVGVLVAVALMVGDALALIVDVALLDGEALIEGDPLALADALALVLALADALLLGEALIEGDELALADALLLGDALIDGDALALALADALLLADALTLEVALLLADALTVGVALLVGVALALLVAVAVGLDVAVLHTGRVMVLSSSVTAPLRASRRPSIVAPVFALMEVRARMLPRKVEFVPSVAELPTCQNTLHAWAPLIRATLLPEAVTRVEAIWKMNTALGSPWASSVTVPVRFGLEVDA